MSDVTMRQPFREQKCPGLGTAVPQVLIVTDVSGLMDRTHKRGDAPCPQALSHPQGSHLCKDNYFMLIEWVIYLLFNGELPSVGIH